MLISVATEHASRRPVKFGSKPPIDSFMMSHFFTLEGPGRSGVGDRATPLFHGQRAKEGRGESSRRGFERRLEKHMEL